MTFDEYQEAALQTAIYPGCCTDEGLLYSLTNLAAESGEALSILSKAIRDDEFTDDHMLTSEKRKKLKAEIGDCLWQIAAVAFDIGYTLEDIAQENLEKLNSRQKRGVLGGSGDER